MQNVNLVPEDYPALLLMFLVTDLVSHVPCIWIFCWNTFGIWNLVTIAVIVISCLMQSLFLNFFFLVLLPGFPISFQCYLNCFQNKTFVTESAEKTEGFVFWVFPNYKVALPIVTEELALALLCNKVTHSLSSATTLMMEMISVSPQSVSGFESIIRDDDLCGSSHKAQIL